MTYLKRVDSNKIQGIDVDDANIGDGKVLRYSSASGNLEYSALMAVGQFYDSAGGLDVNVTTPVAIPFDSETKKDIGITHDNTTDNSRIHLDEPGWYRVSYCVSHENQTTGRKNIRCRARLDGATDIIPSDSYSYSRNTDDESYTP